MFRRRWFASPELFFLTLRAQTRACTNNKALSDKGAPHCFSSFNNLTTAYPAFAPAGRGGSLWLGAAALIRSYPGIRGDARCRRFTSAHRRLRWRERWLKERRARTRRRRLPPRTKTSETFFRTTSIKLLSPALPRAEASQRREEDERQVMAPFCLLWTEVRGQGWLYCCAHKACFPSQEMAEKHY